MRTRAARRHGERAARDREAQREEREERIDRDRVLHLDERHAPDGGDDDERRERSHGEVVDRSARCDSISARRTPRRRHALPSVRRWTTLDTLGRPLRDLRISVTDRCNFRCTYCMPKEVYGRDHRFLDRRELLTFEEITPRRAHVRRARHAKIRITGGEPLVRRDLERLVEQLAALDVDLTLTTNASLLAAKAQRARRRRACSASPSASTRSTTRPSAR